jgi:type III secretion protein L
MERPFCLKEKPVTVAAGSKIIKAGDYQRYMSAMELLDRAEKESQSILEKAADAYEAEKQKGYSEGISQGEKKIAEAVTRATLQGEAYVDSIDTQIVTTIISALKIILAEIGEEEVMVQLVKKALLSARKDDRLILKVSGDQADAVRRLVGDMCGQGAEGDWIEVVADYSLQNGSCIVTSKAGSTDISLDVQLEMIRTILAERMIRDRTNE